MSRARAEETGMKNVKNRGIFKELKRVIAGMDTPKVGETLCDT